MRDGIRDVAAACCQRLRASLACAGFRFAPVVLVAIVFTAMARPSSPTAPRPLAPKLPVITTAHTAHQLSLQEAARGYPVHLRVVVTYYDDKIDPRRPSLFVHDSSGGVFVALSKGTAVPLRAGQLIEVQGRSGMGDFAPIVDYAQARVIGQSHLPSSAPRVTMGDLLTGSEDGQWIELEAIVLSVRQIAANEMLELALRDGNITASTLRDSSVDYARLVDSRIVIRGSTGPLFNHRGQLTGAHLVFPSLATVQIEQPAPAQPFRSPVTRVADLLRYSPKTSFVHRAHLRGTVTLFWPGRQICIQDPSGGLCAQTDQTISVSLGEVVDLLGFPVPGENAPTLTHAIYSSLGILQPISLTAATAAQALQGDYDSRLIQIEGLLLGTDRAAADPTILLSAGKFIFPAVLPRQSGLDATRAWETGSSLRVIGICSVRNDLAVRSPKDGFAVAESFRILLRSPADVVVVRRPSWWNAEHTLRVLAFALAVTVGVLCWVAYLRRRLKQQAERLQYQATHDSLTGAWNRKAILDLLRREFALAARSEERVGVVMLDADHFKRVNDTHGHLAGDAVLKELATRIRQAVRNSDLTGRYGGEEFLIVVPGCDAEEIEQCAERVRAAVADAPIDADGVLLAMTVSLGTAVLDPLFNTERDALSAADGALYQAKRSGRNRVVAGILNPEPTLLDTPQTYASAGSLD